MASGDKIYIADKPTLDTVKTNTDTIKSDTATTKSDAADIKSKVGATNDTGGSATAGGIFAKLNAVIKHLLDNWTATRAAKLDKIDSISTQTTNLVNNPVGGQGTRMAKFTSNGTFTVPAGVTAIKVLACAAGGDGYLYYGGRGGQCFEGVLPVTAGQNIAITVGAGNTIIGNLLTLIAGLGAPAGEATQWASPGRDGGGNFGGKGGGAGLGGGGGGGGGGGATSYHQGGNGGAGLYGGGGGGGGGGANSSTSPVPATHAGAATGVHGGDGGAGGVGYTNGSNGASTAFASGGTGATYSSGGNFGYGGGGGGGAGIGAGGNGLAGNASNQLNGAGGGGGGGYGAGGGGGGYPYENTMYTPASPGKGGAGLVVIEW